LTWDNYIQPLFDSVLIFPQMTQHFGVTKLFIISKGQLQELKYPAFKTLNAELNPICYLLSLLGAHHFLHVSRI